MGKLYTISPFIKADNLPRRASVEAVISDNFYLFNVYNHSPYPIKVYMDFMDANFNYAFSKLKYEIISYEYPDRLKNDDSDIIEYINVKYDLGGDYQLDLSYQMNKEIVKDLLTGSEIEIYFNDYAYYDIGLLEYSIISDPDNEILYYLLDEIKYLSDRRMRNCLNRLIYQFIDYQSGLDYTEQRYFDNEIISNGMLTICQLKSYVKKLVKERGE